MTPIKNSHVATKAALPDQSAARETWRTRVAIVGAGPTGLALACALAQSGVDFLIVDKARKGANTSRAAVIHARTLEALEELGVSQQLVQEGHIVPKFSLRERDKILNSIAFSGLPTRYPFTLMIPQYRTEAILHDRLESLGGRVIWSCDATALSQDDVGCRIDAQKEDGEPVTISADFVVGADGLHSVVREAEQIPFDGGSYKPSFVLADVAMDWPLPDNEVELFFSPEGLVVVAPLPGGRYRVVATLDNAPKIPTVSDIQALLDQRGPRASPATVHDVVWSSRFHVHHRVAQRFVQGRVLLAGDAAHVHSPAGGQGMNTGIQDALELACVLRDVLKPNVTSVRCAEAFAGYDRRRRKIAHRVVTMTDRMTRAALLRSRTARDLRNFLISTIGSIPKVRHKLAFELSELRNRPQAFDPKEHRV